jgi:hypothetical protein
MESNLVYINNFEAWVYSDFCHYTYKRTDIEFTIWKTTTTAKLNTSLVFLWHVLHVGKLRIEYCLSTNEIILHEYTSYT